MSIKWHSWTSVLYGWHLVTRQINDRNEATVEQTADLSSKCKLRNLSTYRASSLSHTLTRRPLQPRRYNQLCCMCVYVWCFYFSLNAYSHLHERLKVIFKLKCSRWWFSLCVSTWMYAQTNNNLKWNVCVIVILFLSSRSGRIQQSTRFLHIQQTNWFEWRKNNN